MSDPFWNSWDDLEKTVFCFYLFSLLWFYPCMWYCFDTIPAPLSSAFPHKPPSCFHVCFECAHLISLACLSSSRVIYFWEGSNQWLYHSGMHFSLSLQSLIAYNPSGRSEALSAPLLPWWSVVAGRLCLTALPPLPDFPESWRWWYGHPL